MKRSAISAMPTWLQPGVAQLLPIPEKVVSALLGQAVQRHRRAMDPEKARRDAVARGNARTRALSPERRSEIAHKAALAKNARMSVEQRRELGRRAGKASQAARSPYLKKVVARKAAKATNHNRWGIPGATVDCPITLREFGCLKVISAAKQGITVFAMISAGVTSDYKYVHVMCGKMCKRGLLTKRKERNGRIQTTWYSITDKGRCILAQAAHLVRQ